LTVERSTGFTPSRMLATHQRAAWIPNEPNVAWHHFILSRFVGRLPGRDWDAILAVVVHTISQQSETHAELRGTTEYASGSSLPVVFEFAGSLLLDSREISIDELHLNQPRRNYSGQFSENGRVMALRSRIGGGETSKEFHLIHEATLARLTSE